MVAGSRYVTTTPYTATIPVRTGTGYDGQFYFRMALGPLNWAHSAFGITLDTTGRLQRVTYPALVWLVSAGQAAAVPVMMVVVNVAAVGALTGVAAALARSAGRHPLDGLLVSAFPGFLWSLSRDLTELTEAVFVVAALLALRRARPVLGGALLALAVLAREEALLVVAAVALARAWQLAQARRRRGPPSGSVPGQRWADAAWAVPAAVFAAWQVALRVGTGSFPALTSGHNNSGLPLVGLADGLAHYAHNITHVSSWLWFVELALLVIVGWMAATSLRSSTAPRHEKVAWVGAAVLAVCLAKGIWLGDVGFRSLDDFYVLSAVVLLSSPRPLRVPALAAAATWGAVALQLVLFI